MAGGADLRSEGLPDGLRWSVLSAGPPAGAPIISGALLVVPLQGGMIAAHHLGDGSIAWKAKLAVEQPLIGDAERVYAVAGEAIHALDARTGATQWRAVLGGAATAPPVAHAGWILVPAAGTLLAFRAADGEAIWQQTVGAVEFRAAIDGDLAIVPLVEGHVLALDIQTGATRWKTDLASAPSEPFAIGGRAYVGSHDKHFHALDAESGSIEWSWLVGARVVGRAAADDKHVYFAAMDNVLWTIDRGHGAIKWKKGLTYRPAAGPVLLGRNVVVPGPVRSLPAFAPRTGAPSGAISFPDRLIQLPLLGETAEGGTLAIGVTGNLENRWSLSVYSPLTVPTVPVAPLTILPGQAVAMPTAVS